MSNLLQAIAGLGVGVCALVLGCSRQNEEAPMTPANATGQPRPMPDSRYDGGVRSSTTSDPQSLDDPTRPPQTYPNPETTPPEMHPEH